VSLADGGQDGGFQRGLGQRADDVQISGHLGVSQDKYGIAVKSTRVPSKSKTIRVMG